VCRPFHRRIICTRTFARRAITTVLLMAAIVSIHKPLLSGIYDVTASHGDVTTEEPPSLAATDTTFGSVKLDVEGDGDQESWTGSDDGDDAAAMSMTSSDDRRVCRSNPAYSWKFIFITEIVYGLSITVIPFVPITEFPHSPMTS